MGNINAEMAEFAENLWANFIKPKMMAELSNYVSYYRAKVDSNEDGQVIVRRPFDNPFPVNTTENMGNVRAGDEVLVFSLGKGNAANQLIFAFSDGVTPPPEDMGTVRSVTIRATSPIAVNSTAAITTSGTRTISHRTSGVSAGSYGDSGNQTPGFGDTFKALSATVNDTGHVTVMGEHTVTMPDAAATSTAAGLMSAADKTKLDGIAETIEELGSLAYKDSASGSFTPDGEIAVTLTTTSKYVAGSTTGGGSATAGTPAQCTLPVFSTSVSGETLTFNWSAGSFTANTPTAVTMPTFAKQTIATAVNSQTFTGTAGTVTVS